MSLNLFPHFLMYYMMYVLNTINAEDHVFGCMLMFDLDHLFV